MQEAKIIYLNILITIQSQYIHTVSYKLILINVT